MSTSGTAELSRCYKAENLKPITEEEGKAKLARGEGKAKSPKKKKKKKKKRSKRRERRRQGRKKDSRWQKEKANSLRSFVVVAPFERRSASNCKAIFVDQKDKNREREREKYSMS